MNVAIIGSGGREHVLAWKIRQSPLAGEVFVVPGNGGTSPNLAVAPGDFDALAEMCRRHRIDLLVVGPEAPLVEGIRDHFRGSEVMVFGPSKAAAQLEGSKIFAKRFMSRHGVATAEAERFEAPAAARDLVASRGGEVVIKYDGLAGGKGVFVTSSVAEAHEALDTIADTYGPDSPLVVEERLHGQEISILGITDGETIKLLTPSQDHKQRFANDEGPMTGGMGAFCPVPGCDEALMERIVADVVTPTMRGIAREGLDYVGVLYFGLMVTREGPKLLEYHVRFGDPEAEAVLPKLESDLLALIRACFDGSLSDRKLSFHPGFFVDVVLASDGYPGRYPTGVPITGLDEVLPDCLVFHAGTRRDGDQVLTSGGRVLNVVARGATLDRAIERAYRQADQIAFETKALRRDIGRREWVL